MCKNLFLLITSFLILHAQQRQNFKLLIKLPTRSRPEQFFSCLNKYYENLSNTIDYRFLITCDTDDPTMNNSRVITRLSKYKNLDYSFGKSVSKVDAYNRDINNYSDFDVLVVTSDDLVPIQKNYDIIIRDKMLQYFPDTDGVLQFYDGNIENSCQLNTYPIIGKKYYDRFKYVYHPFYKSVFCDDEVTCISHAFGKCAEFSQILLFAHCHPSVLVDPAAHLKQYANDALYKLNESSVIYNYDRLVFGERKKNGFHIDWTTQKIIKLSIVLLAQEQKKLEYMQQEINQQANGLGFDGAVEVLVGKNALQSADYTELLQKVRGEYICFIPFVCDINVSFVPSVFGAIASYPDCVNVALLDREKAASYSLMFVRHDVAIKYNFQQQPNCLKMWLKEVFNSKLLKNVVSVNID